MTNETLRLALEALDDLGDDAAAHIWPDDLKKCMTSECVVQVASVRMGSPYCKTVPLFSLEQVEEALRAAIDVEQADGQEPVAVPHGYPCEIEEADFEANTITVKMLTNDYRIHAGEYRLSAAPSPAPVGIKKENHDI